MTLHATVWYSSQQALLLDDGLAQLVRHCQRNYPQLFSQPWQAKPLSGLTNPGLFDVTAPRLQTQSQASCWLIRCHDGQQVVWRPEQPNNILGGNRAQEGQILAHLAEVDFAPNVLLSLPQGLLLQWQEGISLADYSATEAEQLLGRNPCALVIELLAQLHQRPVAEYQRQKTHNDIVPFDYFCAIEQYWQQLEPQLQTSLQPYQALLHQPISPKMRPLCWCHFDIHPANIIIQAEQKIGLIDWEFAQLADPVVDIAISLNSFNLPQQPALMADYIKYYCQLRQIESVDEWQQQVSRWLPKVQYLSCLWFLLAYQVYQEPIYLDYAQQQQSQLDLLLQQAGFV